MFWWPWSALATGRSGLSGVAASAVIWEISTIQMNGIAAQPGQLHRLPDRHTIGLFFALVLDIGQRSREPDATISRYHIASEHIDLFRTNGQDVSATASCFLCQISTQNIRPSDKLGDKAADRLFIKRARRIHL